MKKTLYVVVEMFGGWVQDTPIFTSEDEAIKEFEDYTEETYEDYLNDNIEWGDNEEAHVFIQEIELTPEELEQAAREYLQQQSEYDKGYNDGFADGYNEGKND